eukprot:CAMPEP_0181487256 /NCGR_PEP_ID=MMETSP1110-20121109/47705_1 /TAXON_ID=174948 /ORGANISM="Symbiodinium sp., Strain CCMP421" /LENGTH=146 /DNA_ID=CAMNT_0023613717 /DNA_START=47 /DNA_END=487 /DNA_ORIENTATION=-
MDAQPQELLKLAQEDPEEVDVLVPKRSKWWWPLFALAAALLVLVAWHGSGAYSASVNSAVGLSECAMTCAAGSVCCGGKECCTGDSTCCGNTCLSKGSTCCRNSTQFPLMCTPGTSCCGKETAGALCCTTGCAQSVFKTEVCNTGI